MSFTPDVLTTEEALASILESPLPALPPQEQRYGSTLVSWWETDPGEVYIHAEDGTPDDRHYASTLVALQLQPHGYRRAQFNLDPEPETLQRTSAWPDLMAKAKRLVDSGQVHVLRNGYNNIMGHVVGDHGEYDTEISRDDPNTRSITGWQCTCPWDQYAWQRTRKWKKFEGRPCAHVLGLYWKALSTPLDEQLTEEQAQGMGTGQRLPGDQMIGPRAPVPHVPGGPSGPRVFGPEGPEQGKQMQMNLPPDALGGPPGPAQAPIAPPPGNGGPGGHPGGHPGGPSGPEPPGVIPPFPGEQQQLPWAGPGTTPGGMESPPGAMSLPGAKPPNPFNPIQNPGTYSKVAMPMTRPQQLRAWEQTRMDQGYEPQSEKVWEHPSGWSVQHHPTYGDMKSVGRMLRNCWQSAGSTTANFDDQPLSHDQDAPNHYLPYALHDSDDIPRVAFWATHPNQNYSGSTENLERRIDSPLGPRNSDLYMLENQEARPYLGQFADEQGYYLPSFYRTSKVAADFNPPETVRFKKPVLGIAEGPVQGQYGDGEYRESEDPSGEVISQDPTTGWVEVISPLHSSGPHEPYHIRCFVEPSDIEKTDSTNAFINRRTKVATELDPSLERQFTYGACGGLAMALHHHTGWPLVKVTDSHSVYDPNTDEALAGRPYRERAAMIGNAGMGAGAMHWAVRHPDGRLVDVDGAHDPQQMLERYEGLGDEEANGEAALGYSDLQDAEDEYEEKGQPVPVDQAMQYVPAVLSRISGSDS